MRTTTKELCLLAVRACDALGLDYGPQWSAGKAIVGRVQLAKGYSGWDLERIVNEEGGRSALNGYCRSMTGPEMKAFLEGLIAAQRILRLESRP